MNRKDYFAIRIAAPLVISFLIRQIIKVILSPWVTAHDIIKGVSGKGGLLQQLRDQYEKYEESEKHVQH